MSLCDCPERARCEAYSGACGNFADGSCMVPLTWKAPPVRLGPKFYCRECWDRFCVAWRTPMKGIDRPAGVDPEDWKPSIMEHIRLCAIDMQINEQAEQNRLARSATNEHRSPAADSDLSRPWEDERYTPAQLQQVYVWRRALREARL